MRRTEMIENTQGFAAVVGIVLVVLLMATLLIGGLFTMVTAGQDAEQARTGLGMILGALGWAFVLVGIVPTR